MGSIVAGVSPGTGLTALWPTDRIVRIAVGAFSAGVSFGSVLADTVGAANDRWKPTMSPRQTVVPLGSVLATALRTTEQEAIAVTVTVVGAEFAL